MSFLAGDKKNGAAQTTSRDQRQTKGEKISTALSTQFPRHSRSGGGTRSIDSIAKETPQRTLNSRSITDYVYLGVSWQVSKRMVRPQPLLATSSHARVKKNQAQSDLTAAQALLQR
jgi:hypothetical protein